MNLSYSFLLIAFLAVLTNCTSQNKPKEISKSETEIASPVNNESLKKLKFKKGIRAI